MSENLVLLEKIESLRKEQAQKFEHINDNITAMIELVRMEMKSNTDLNNQKSEQQHFELVELKGTVEENQKRLEAIETVIAIERSQETVEDKIEGKYNERRKFTIVQLLQAIAILAAVAIGILAIILE